MAQEVRTQSVEFPTDGAPMPGYLALPPGEEPFPAVVVVQEWWGLDSHIQDVARRFAGEGFVALAPDLYRGRVASEPDEAQKLMMALDMNRAGRELMGAADYLASQPYTRGRGMAAVGFCMGGGLALTLACDSPHIRAAALFYGINPNPVDKVRSLRGPVLAIYAEHDDWVNAKVREELRQALLRHNKEHEVIVYPGTQHAFFNDTRPSVHNAEASRDAWRRLLDLLRHSL